MPSVPDQTSLLTAALGLPLDDPAIPVLAATLLQSVVLVTGGAEAALFDTEPSHHARALEAAAMR